MKKNLLFTTILMAIFLLGACSETEITLEQPQKIEAESIEPDEMEEGKQLKEKGTEIETAVKKDTTKKELSELEKDIQAYLNEYHKISNEQRNVLVFDREVTGKWFDIAGFGIISGFDRETWLKNEEHYFPQHQEGTLKNEHVWLSEMEVIELLKEYQDAKLDLPAFEVAVKVKELHQYYDENETLIENKTYTEEYKATAYLAKVESPYGYAVIGFDYEEHF